MNLKKMTGEPVPAPRHIFRPVPAPRQIRRPELDKLVLCDVPCQEVEVEGGERPLGQKVGHQVPVPAGSRELEAEEEPSGESNPTLVSHDYRRRQRRKKKKKKDKIRMITVEGCRRADTESSSSEEETDREKIKPTKKCYDINIVKPLSEIVRISGRLQVHRITLSDIEEDQTWENEEEEEDNQDDESDDQDFETGDYFEPETELEIRNDNAEAEIDRGNAEEAEPLDDVKEDVERYEGKVQGEEETEADEDPEEDEEPDWDRNRDQEEEENKDENNNDEEGQNGDQVEEDEDEDEEDEDEDEDESAVGAQRWVTDESRPYEYEKGQENDDEEIGGGEDEDEDDEYEVDEEYEDEEQSGDDSICDVYDSCDDHDYVYDNDEY